MTGSSNSNIFVRRRGVTALIAMLFLILVTTLTLAMFHVAGGNVQTSANFSDLSKAQAAAESGLRWTSYRFLTMPRPRELSGTITPSIAAGIWSRPGGLRETLVTSLRQVRDQTGTVITVTNPTPDRVEVTSKVPTDIQGATFTVSVRQLGPADGYDARYLRVTSTGFYRGAVRSVSMDFEIEKRAKFAVVGKVPLQFGRNTLIEGPVGMVTANKYPPVLILSDFTHFHAGLKSKIEAWQTYLKGSGSYDGRTVRNHIGYDGRISVNNKIEYSLATAAGYRDVNGDAYIDEYDLFVSQFDSNRDGAITRSEFTNPNTGKLYDENLFTAIDSLSPPQFNEDKNGNGFLDYGEDANGNGELDADPIRQGFQDGVINNFDGYSKMTGQLLLATTANAWTNKLGTSGKVINDYIGGGIAPSETGQTTIKFGANGNDLLDLNPANFEEAANQFRNKTGTAAGPAVRLPGRIENTTLLASDTAYSLPYTKVTASGGTALKVGEWYPTTVFNAANAEATAAGKAPATGTAAASSVDERVPYGSTSYQATYRRPVYYGIAFKNVQLPKGINGLFVGCTFLGVTFVEVERNITNSSGVVSTSPSDGMSWSQKMISGSFSKDTVLTPTNSHGYVKGNNLRFHNSTFEGPIASNYATAYTHFTNSWEFTGATMFDNKVDQTATLVAPQTNIEMGSFTDPKAAPSTLIGVVVAGNIDIRGTSVVDGSIIVTGDGAGNTTLGYFGPSDGDTNPVALPETGGYGMLRIHYNPYRTLPDGINLPVFLRPWVNTYREGVQ